LIKKVIKKIKPAKKFLENFVHVAKKANLAAPPPFFLAAAQAPPFFYAPFTSFSYEIPLRAFLQ
jgi:hypothetical protein